LKKFEIIADHRRRCLLISYSKSQQQLFDIYMCDINHQYRWGLSIVSTAANANADDVYVAAALCGRRVLRRQRCRRDAERDDCREKKQ
jgi:hypothetical protein